ncbi:MAG: alkaline phosphatase family protein, partial [Bdellovibrionia bacterium]
RDCPPPAGYAPAAASVPGSWRPAACSPPPSAGGFQAPDQKVIAKIVTLYDALFLQQAQSPLKKDEEPSVQLIERAKPLVRDVLASFQNQMKGDENIGAAIDSVLKDPERLEVITVSLIMAIHHESYKAYQIFAKRIMRQEALKKWLTDRASDKVKDSPKVKDVVEYLNYAQTGRRYAIHVTVDGLQGHLVEALSKNYNKSHFMRGLLEDNRPPAKPTGRQVSQLDKKINSQFLEMFVRGGYTDENYLPLFRRIYTGRNGVARSGVSTTPTISVRNLPIVKTGNGVTSGGRRGACEKENPVPKDCITENGSTGIPNFHWVDRNYKTGNGRAYYFYGNDALQLERLAETNHMKTMFSRLTGLNTFDCNAQYEKGANAVFNPFLNLAVGEKIRDFGDALCVRDLKRRAANEVKLRAARQEMLTLLAPGGLRRVWRAFSPTDQIRISQLIEVISTLEDDSLPQYMLYYNPWPDHFGHFVGPFSDEVISPTGELNRLDFWLRQVESAYRDGGVLGRVMWGMAGDHGLTPVFHLLNPEVEVFDSLKARGINLIIEKISSDEGEGPKMNHPTKPHSMRGKDVVIASTAGGNYMMDFFIHDRANWARQPLYAELTKWKTLAGAQIDIVNEIVSKLKDSLDYLVVREEACTHAGGSIRLLATRGGNRVAARITRRENKIFYESAADLLEVKIPSKYDAPSTGPRYAELQTKCLQNAAAADVNTWCNEDEWRELTSYTNRPDSVGQLAHIYDTDLAGTVNLFPMAGIGYNTKVPGRHAGEHFHEKDAFVGFWGVPVNAPARPRSVVNGSIAPTLYDYLTFRSVTPGHDGWGFPSVFVDVK